MNTDTQLAVVWMLIEIYKKSLHRGELWYACIFSYNILRCVLVWHVQEKQTHIDIAVDVNSQTFHAYDHVYGFEIEKGIHFYNNTGWTYPSVSLTLDTKKYILLRVFFLFRLLLRALMSKAFIFSKTHSYTLQFVMLMSLMLSRVSCTWLELLNVLICSVYD